MQDDYNQQFVKNRQLLMKAVSEVVKELLKDIDKSIKLFSREYDFGDGQISKLLRGKYFDVKLSTIWKLSEALEVSPVTFVDMIKKKLPKDFNFYD